jgi:hypothetical protein
MIMIFFMFPRALPDHTLVKPVQQQQHARSSSSSSGGSIVYNIVLDAGSTGSRIHIYKFRQQGQDLGLISDGFHQLKPGLSSFRDDPVAAAKSLAPLMEEAMKEVPKEQQVGSVAVMVEKASWWLPSCRCAVLLLFCNLPDMVLQLEVFNNTSTPW